MRPKFAMTFRYAGFDVRLTGDIHRKRRGCAGPELPSSPGRFLRCRHVAIGNHYNGAGLSEGSGDLLADGRSRQPVMTATLFSSCIQIAPCRLE